MFLERATTNKSFTSVPAEITDQIPLEAMSKQMGDKGD